MSREKREKSRLAARERQTIHEDGVSNLRRASVPSRPASSTTLSRDFSPETSEMARV